MTTVNDFTSTATCPYGKVTTSVGVDDGAGTPANAGNGTLEPAEVDSAFWGCLADDSDGDGLAFASDTCPGVNSTNNTDSDGDGQGDICDTNVCNAGSGSTLTDCDNTAAVSCVNTQTSSANCGTCGNACGAGQSCNSGVCGVPVCDRTSATQLTIDKSFALPPGFGAGGSSGDPVTMAWSGTKYFVGGSCCTGYNLGRHAADGTWEARTASQNDPDIRSVFFKGGEMFIRPYSSSTLQKVTGDFASTPMILTFTPDITLAGALDTGSNVTPNGNETEYWALNSNGTKMRFDATTGAALTGVTLAGWNGGPCAGENTIGFNPSGPAGIRGVAGGQMFYTYYDGYLSEWDTAGNRVRMFILNGASTGSWGGFGLSYADGRIWTRSDDSKWVGYVIPAAAP